MNWHDVVSLASTYSRVLLSISYGTSSLKVGAKLLTRLRSEDGAIVLQDVSFDERDILVEADSETFYFTPHYRDNPIVLARLPPLSEDRLRPSLQRRWRNIAPKSVARSFDPQRG